MKKIFLTPKQNSDGSELAQYVRDAFAWAREFKSTAQQRILATDHYFRHKEKVPDLVVKLCDEGCASNAVINLDAIGGKIDAFVTVATDAIIQVDKPWEISPTARPELPTGYR